MIDETTAEVEEERGPVVEEEPEPKPKRRVKSIAELEKDYRELGNRIRREKRKAAEAERKARTHALIVFGGMIEAETGDWRGVDYDGLAEWIRRHGGELSAFAGDERETGNATEDLRAFEDRRRGGGSSAEASAEIADAPAPETVGGWFA